MSIWINDAKKQSICEYIFIFWVILVRYILPITTALITKHSTGILYMGLPFATNFFYLPTFETILVPAAIDYFLLVLSFILGIGLYIFMFLLIGKITFLSAAFTFIPSTINQSIRNVLDPSKENNCCAVLIVTLLYLIFVQVGAMVWSFIPYELIFFAIWKRRFRKNREKNEIKEPNIK